MGRFRYRVKIDGAGAADYSPDDPHDPRTDWAEGQAFNLRGQDLRLEFYLLTDPGEYAGMLIFETPEVWARRAILGAFAQASATGEPVLVATADHEPLSKEQLIGLAQHLRATEDGLGAAIEDDPHGFILRPANT